MLYIQNNLILGRTLSTEGNISLISSIFSISYTNDRNYHIFRIAEDWLQWILGPQLLEALVNASPIENMKTSQSKFASGKNETSAKNQDSNTRILWKKLWVLCFELIYATEISLILNALAGKADGRKLGESSRPEQKEIFLHLLHEQTAGFFFLPPDI